MIKILLLAFLGAVSDTKVAGTLNSDGMVTAGAGAEITGRQTYTPATIVGGDTSPDISAGTVFFTSSNTGPTAITTLDGETIGQVLTICGGSNTNSSTIATGGQFSPIPAAGLTFSVDYCASFYVQGLNDFVFTGDNAASSFSGDLSGNQLTDTSDNQIDMAKPIDLQGNAIFNSSLDGTIPIGMVAGTGVRLDARSPGVLGVTGYAGTGAPAAIALSSNSPTTNVAPSPAVIKGGQDASPNASTAAYKFGANFCVCSGAGSQAVVISDYTNVTSLTVNGNHDCVAITPSVYTPSANCGGAATNSACAVNLAALITASLPTGIASAACSDAGCTTPTIYITPLPDTCMVVLTDVGTGITSSSSVSGGVSFPIGQAAGAGLCLKSSASGTTSSYAQDCTSAIRITAGSFGLGTSTGYISDGYLKSSTTLGIESNGSGAGTNLHMSSGANASGEYGVSIGSWATDGGGASNASLLGVCLNCQNASPTYKFIVNGGGMAYSPAKTITTNDSGADSDPAATAINPADANTIILVCSDDDGCTGTITETSAAAGMRVTLIGGTGYTTTIADSAGVIETTGGTSIALTSLDVVEIVYDGGQWLQATPVSVN
jgi:hypothetical protein